MFLFFTLAVVSQWRHLRSERGKSVPQNHMAEILLNGSEVLRIMREDSRYSAPVWKTATTPDTRTHPQSAPPRCVVCNSIIAWCMRISVSNVLKLTPSSASRRRNVASLTANSWPASAAVQGFSGALASSPGAHLWAYFSSSGWR